MGTGAVSVVRRERERLDSIRDEILVGGSGPRIEGPMRSNDSPFSSEHATPTNMDKRSSTLHTSGTQTPTSGGGVLTNAARPVGLVLRSGLLGAFLLSSTGCMIYYEEEMRGIHVPEPEVVSVPVAPHTPFTITYRWDGLNYAFNILWLIVDDGQTDGGVFEVKGTVRCSDGTPRTIETGLSGVDVHERENRAGGRFSAWIYVEDEYRRASSTPITCTGVLAPTRGAWRSARIAVTQRQRPSDFVAF